MGRGDTVVAPEAHLYIKRRDRQPVRWRDLRHDWWRVDFIADHEKSNAVRANSVRILLSIAAALDLKVKGVDIDQAFLLADKESDEPVYMKVLFCGSSKACIV